MKLNLFTKCGCALMLALPLTTRAQYAIDWHTIDGGGGTSSGGAFSLNGSIGQPDASAAMSGGNFSLVGGFWSFIAVPTPGAPSLKISFTIDHRAVISWPWPSTGFVLEQNVNLKTTSWAAPSETVIDDGTNRSITVTPQTGNHFYRLVRP